MKTFNINNIMQISKNLNLTTENENHCYKILN